MLRIVEQAHRTDTGRQRTANEDAYFARSPVYAVADGMGGAQAGEVASKIAADAFDARTESEESPESYLERVVREANDRIHELAQQDAEHSGMGTTLTAAVVRGDEISLAHVGDSRAYLLRGGELRRLTSDHSLVEEMRRRGQLTERQAEEHPQRSIITRALGPEAQVDVDTMTVQGEPGDIVLLCSDGLTTMVQESRIAEILGGARTLDVGVRHLIKEANTEGGRDNITVVAFRLEGAEARAEAEDVTLVGPSAEEAGLTAETVGAGAAQRSRRPGGYVPPRRSRSRRVGAVLAAIAVVAVIVGGAVYGARQIYFLGTDDGGRLALYRGLPYDLPAGVSLYSQQTSAPVQVASLPANRRDSVTNHELRSHDDAVSLFDDLERSAAIPSGGGGKSGGGGGKGQGASGGGGSNGGGGSTQGDGGGSGGKGSQKQ